MYNKTDNEYRFLYLVTGIRDNGIPCVYLPKEGYPDHDKLDPDKIPKKDILDFDGRWVKQPLPEKWKEWKEWEYERNKLLVTRLKDAAIYHDDYEWHPLRAEFANREWERRMAGVWIWLNEKGEKKLFYLTGLHYFMLQWWPVTFKMEYRDVHRELFYWIQYWMEDPYSLGGVFGTHRQWAKSVILGVWGIEGVTRTPFGHLGEQGETAESIKSFYSKHQLFGFKRLIDFFTPEYDKNGLQTNGIDFVVSGKRNKRLSEEELGLGIEAHVDYGKADVNRYNGQTLTHYIGEESGKVKEVPVYDRHIAVSSALRERNGKAFHASTSDDIDPKCKTFKKMVMDSDFNQRMPNGETKSGLYFAFMPAQYSFNGRKVEFDEYGFPNTEENMKVIMAMRKELEDDPAAYTMFCRKYPTTITEYFYVDSNKCQFDARVLQDAVQRCDENPHLFVRGNLVWQGGKRFGKVVWEADQANGKFQLSQMPDMADQNQILDKGESMGSYRFSCQNDQKYASGTDPIQFKVVQLAGGGSRRSNAVFYIKRKYDHLLEGELTPALKQERRDNKYAYKTGIPVMRYGNRPLDPDEYFEDSLMACWFFGIRMLIEKTCGELMIKYFENAGCADFVMDRPAITRTSDRYNQETQGIAASAASTQMYTNMISKDVKYFGHRYPFRELPEDLLQFDPYNTLEYDDSVAWGLTLIAEQDTSILQVPEAKDISMYNRLQ